MQSIGMKQTPADDPPVTEGARTVNRLASIVTSHSAKASDKWSSYIDAYDELFAPYEARPVRLLEIGVMNGGSLEIWAKYFPNAALLLGCDFTPACATLQFDDPRISVVVADAYSSEGLQRISASAGEFDIIIDDGSHKSSDIVRAFFQYFPILADGGLFIAEDLHCSYWRDFDGGLHDPLSSMSFFKLLADIVNHEHWGIGDTAGSLLSRFSATLGVNVTDDILAGIHSIEFRNSLCIVSKRPAAENTLGQRVVSGQVAAIDPRFSKLDGTNPIKSDESGNEWSRDARSLAAELSDRTREAETLRARVQALSDRTREAETLRERVQALSAEVEVGKAALQQSEIERARAECDFVAADSARQNSEKELARANEHQVALERELERFQTHAGKSRNVVLFGRRFRLDFAIGGEPVFPREFARYIPVADAAKVFVRSIGQAVRRRLRVLAGKPAFDPGQMEDAVPGLAEASRKKA